MTAPPPAVAPQGPVAPPGPVAPSPAERAQGAPGEPPAAPTPAADEGPSDAKVLMLAAKPGERLFRVLEKPDPLRPLLAVLAMLPAILAGPRCRLDRVDPDWGVTCLRALQGEPLVESGAAAWITGRLLAWAGTGGPVPYYVVSWAGATLLVWAVWQLVAAAAGPRPAAFAAVLTATNPVTAASAASAPPTVLGAAFAVIAAWLWVRSGRGGSRWRAFLAGAAAGGATVLAGPIAGLAPVAVALADLSLKAFTRAERDPRRRDGWAAGLVRLGLFALGLAPAAAPAWGSATLGRPLPGWDAGEVSPLGVWLLVGLAAAGVAAAAGGQGWVGPPVRRMALGLAAAAGIWFALSGGVRPDAGTLNALVAAAVASAVAVEGACRPAVSARGVAALAAFPVLALLGLWAWTDDDPAATARRFGFLLLALVGLWGLWNVVVFRWPRNVRDRRLLIAGLVALSAVGVGWTVRGVDPSAGRGSRQLAAAVAARPERTVFVLAEPADQQAARFLFAAAAPGRTVFVIDPDSGQAAEMLNRGLSKTPSPLVAVVGGGPAARLNALRPAGAAPPSPAGVLRGGGGVMKEVRLLVLPPRKDAAPR